MGLLNKMKSLFRDEELPPITPAKLPDLRYIVIPGAVAKAMPADWQERLACLLGEMKAQMIGLSPMEYKVTAIDPETKKYIKDPLG